MIAPVSAAHVVRNALQQWATSLVADLLPAATVEGGPIEAGQAPPLPTLGLEWGATTVAQHVPYDESVDEPTGAGTWLLHYEDVQLAFVWRAASLEDADLFAHEFATRAALEAVRSNDDGNRVLHFDVELGEETRKGKLYLGGEVVPVRVDDNVTRSLFTYRVPGSVTYPVYAVERDPTGLLNITLVVNGQSFVLEEIVDA